MRAPALALLPSLVLLGCLDWKSGHSTRADGRDAEVDASGSADGPTDGSLTDDGSPTGDAGLDAASDVEAGSDTPPADAAGEPDGAAAGGACPQEACPDEYTCEGDALTYTCAGQYADFPLPRRRPGDNLSVQKLAVDRDAGVVSDLVTGLAWERVATTIFYGFPDASRYCAGLVLGPYDDFRVPTLHELSTLLSAERAGEVDTTVFLSLNESFSLWTSTRDTESVGQHWSLGLFNEPSPFGWPDGEERQVLCVRTERVLYSGRADARFTLLPGDTLVYDDRTGLVWEADVPPELRTVTKARADAHCAMLSTSTGRSFRLPSVAELLSFRDFSKPSDKRIPAPLVSHGEELWTSTAVPDELPLAPFMVVLADGSSGYLESTDETAVAGTRCVSEGAPN
jgi:Protein of unknown function (DUF1566)